MEKSLFERMGGTYHEENGYLIPDLIAQESPHIGIWGQRRRSYLRKHKDAFYTALLLSGKLNEHLEETDHMANEMFGLLIKQCAEQDGITEQFKAQNQLEWLRKMNAIRATAEEIVWSELIYT